MRAGKSKRIIGSSGRTRTSPENPATSPIESILPQILEKTRAVNFSASLMGFSKSTRIAGIGSSAVQKAVHFSSVEFLQLIWLNPISKLRKNEPTRWPQNTTPTNAPRSLKKKKINVRGRGAPPISALAQARELFTAGEGLGPRANAPPYTVKWIYDD